MDIEKLFYLVFSGGTVTDLLRRFVRDWAFATNPLHQFPTPEPPVVSVSRRLAECMTLVSDIMEHAATACLVHFSSWFMCCDSIT